MTRILRRAPRETMPGPKGTRTPHLTARPTGAWVLDFVPDPEESLPGAACTEADPDLFFPEPDPEDAENADAVAAVDFKVRRAKAICAGCPVQGACLERAMRRHEQHGIFGGLTSAERNSLRKSTTAAARRAARRSGGAG